MKRAGLLQPTFLEGGRGALFALHHKPQHANSNALCVVVVPSFAEEMNRCRYMQTLLAQRLNTAGHGLLTVDPYGTGDSAGDFAEGDWQQWIDDTATAIGYARELGYSHVALLGVRLGAMLAASAATLAKVERLLFWQPVANGKVALNQFLRLKIAASMGRDEAATSTSALEDEINAGNSIQVAGYDISPALFKGLKAANLTDVMTQLSLPVDWYTVLASAERKTPRGDKTVMEKWQKAGAQLCHHEIIGPAFWQAHERTLAPALVDATAALLIGAQKEI